MEEEGEEEKEFGGDEADDVDDEEEIEDPFGSMEVELEGTIGPEVNELPAAAEEANKNGGRHRLSECS